MLLINMVADAINRMWMCVCALRAGAHAHTQNVYTWEIWNEAKNKIIFTRLS